MAAKKLSSNRATSTRSAKRTTSTTSKYRATSQKQTRLIQKPWFVYAGTSAAKT
jgi:hypothetical protein